MKNNSSFLSHGNVKSFMVTRQILIIAGPGGTAYGQQDVEKMKTSLEAAGASVALIGDGVSPVNLDDLQFHIESLDTNQPTTLIIQSHGEVSGGGHVLSLEGGYPESPYCYEGPKTQTSTVFDMITRQFGNQPVSIFATCCHGGAALQEIGKLPPGSDVSVLAPASERVAGQDVDRWTTALSQAEDLSAKGLLDVYLTHGLQNRITPNYGVAGAGYLNPASKFAQQIGRSFTEAEQESIHEALDTLMGSNRVTQIIDMLATAKSEWNIPAKDYGDALAVVMAGKPKFDSRVTEKKKDTFGFGSERLTTGPFLSFDM